MIKISKKCFFVLFISVVLFSSVLAQKNSCQSCHEKLKIDVSKSLMKPHSTEERAVGILDKGQLTNYLGNYGVISHYLEYLNDAMHWPAAGNAQTQYCFGLGLVVAVKGNVMTSVLGAFAEKIDWSPKDGSRGEIFSGDVTAPPPDLTPFLPMSDNPASIITIPAKIRSPPLALLLKRATPPRVPNIAPKTVYVRTLPKE